MSINLYWCPQIRSSGFQTISAGHLFQSIQRVHPTTESIENSKQTMTHKLRMIAKLPRWKRNSVIWGKFKNPVCLLCLVSCVQKSWCIIQKATTIYSEKNIEGKLN